MKRSLMTSILLALLFFGLVFGVIFLNDPELFTAKKQAQEKQGSGIDPNELVTFFVSSGSVEYTRSFEGSVISGAPEKYEKNLILDEAEKDRTKIKANLLGDFTAGEVLAACGGRELKADFDGKLISYEFDAENKALVMTALDYGELTVELWVDKELAQQLDYSSAVRLEYDGGTADAAISHIGYELTDGRLQIVLIPQAHLLPGQHVTAVFVTGVRPDCTYLQEQFIYFDFNGSAYTTDWSEEEQKLIRVPLVLGEHFETYDEEGGEPCGCYEILDGVSPGQCLHALETGAPSKNIAELIANE